MSLLRHARKWIELRTWSVAYTLVTLKQIGLSDVPSDSPICASLRTWRKLRFPQDVNTMNQCSGFLEVTNT